MVSYISFGDDDRRQDSKEDNESDIVFARTSTLERPVLGMEASIAAAAVSAADVQRLTANANDAQDVAADLDAREEFRAPS